MRDNQPLHDYYLCLGFEHVRTIELGHRLSGSLFQRAALLNERQKELLAGVVGQSAEHLVVKLPDLHAEVFGHIDDGCRDGMARHADIELM